MIFFRILFFWVFIASANAEDYNKLFSVDIVIPNKTTHQKISKPISDALKENFSSIKININQITPSHQPKEIKELLIGFGDDHSNYNHLLSHYKNSVIFHIRKKRFEQLVANNKNIKNITAIYSDQPIERQVNLGKLIFPLATSFGLLLPESCIHKEQYKNLSESVGIQTNLASADNKHLMRNFVNLIEESSFIVASSKQVYSEDNIQALLLTSYRHNRSIIGLGKNYVKAGVLASTYSDIYHYRSQLLDIVNQIIHQHTVPPASYSTDYSVYVNRHVADSFGLVVPTNQKLEEQLKK